VAGKTEGTGTGLYAAYTNALIMYGDILVESELHKGSKFTLLLPIAVATTRMREAPG